MRYTEIYLFNVTAVLLRILMLLDMGWELTVF